MSGCFFIKTLWVLGPGAKQAQLPRSNGMTVRHSSILFMMCLGGVVINSAIASTDTLQPFVFGSIQYNTNLLRFASTDEALALTGNRHKDTLIHQYGAGANVNLPMSKQLLTLSGQLYQSRYSRYDFLDHTGGSASAGLSLDITRYFQAKLGGEYSRRLSSFDYRPTTTDQTTPKDIRVNSRAYADMSLLFSPDWSMNFSIDQSNNDYSLPQQRFLVRQQDNASIEMRRQGNDGSFLGLGYKHSVVNYPDRQFDQNSQLDNGFKDQRYFVSMRLVPKPYAKLSGRLTAIQRTNDHLSQRDFSTHEAMLNYQHEFNNQVITTLALGRDVSGVSDARSNYITRTSSDLAVKAPVTSRLYSSGTLSATLNEFHDADLLNNRRKDGVVSLNAEMSYEMTKNAVGTVGAMIGYRNSTLDQFDYRYNMLTLKVQATF